MHLRTAKVGAQQKMQHCWAHCAVSNPSFSTSVVCALVPCALHIPLLADYCVHPPLLPPPASITSKTFHHHMPRPPPPLTLLTGCHLLSHRCRCLQLQVTSCSPWLVVAWPLLTPPPLDAPLPLDALAGCRITYSSADAASHCLVDVLPPLFAPPIRLMIAPVGCRMTFCHTPAS
jgi:hypothetical protein